MEVFIIIIIAISLSMDAFSLSLAYGTIGINKKQTYSLGTLVGIFHFFMPLVGLFIGNTILNIIKIEPDKIVFIVFLVIGLDMIYESFKKKKIIKIMKPVEQIFFALAVSIDSLSLGITLNTITNNYLFAIIIFSITSAIFTILGLKIGKKIKLLIGNIATIFGGLIIIIIGLFYLL